MDQRGKGSALVVAPSCLESLESKTMCHSLLEWTKAIKMMGASLCCSKLIDVNHIEIGTPVVDLLSEDERVGYMWKEDY